MAASTFVCAHHFPVDSGSASLADTSDHYAANAAMPMGGSGYQAQPNIAGQAQAGLVAPPFQPGMDMGDLHTGVPGVGDAGVSSMLRSNSGMWQPMETSQRRGLSRGLSGESAVPDPGEWDPLYR